MNSITEDLHQYRLLINVKNFVIGPKDALTNFAAFGSMLTFSRVKHKINKATLPNSNF